MLNSLTAHQLLARLNQKEISTSDIIADIEKRIKRLEKNIKAFVKIDYKDYSKDKDTSQKLYSIPIAIKDNICVKGQETTCSSRILSG